MPLSIEKCAVLHCDKKQPNFNYRPNIQGMLVPVVNKLTNFGLLRSLLLLSLLRPFILVQICREKGQAAKRDKSLPRQIKT